MDIGRPIVRIIILASLTCLFTACSPTNPFVVDRALSADLAGMPHECVPLGWVPIPVPGSYLVGQGVEFEPNGWYLTPFWIGLIPKSDLRISAVKASFDVLEHLVHAGLISKHQRAGAFVFYLTAQGFPYYFDANIYGNNVERAPYLCYSMLALGTVIETQPVRRVADSLDGKLRPTFRVVFEWWHTQNAPWAESAFVRTHSVLLAPTAMPATATFVERKGEWLIDDIRSSSTNRLVDSTAWPQPP